MDNVLSLFSWQLVLFSLGVFVTMYIFRTVIEYILSQWKAIESKLWNDLLLPTMPAIIGCVAAIVLTTYPYPENVTTLDARIVFGLVSGFFSGLVYRVVKKMIVQKFPSTTSNDVSEEK